MISAYTREKIENWVSDFVASDRLRDSPRSTHEHAGAVLVEFLVAACEHRDTEVEDVEQDDLKHALLTRVARLNVPEETKRDLPALCADLLSQLQDEGRCRTAACTARTFAH